MVEDDFRVSLAAPTTEADEAIVSSRQRISWSATQLLAANETSERAREALRQSYVRLGKLRLEPIDPPSDS